MHGAFSLSKRLMRILHAIVERTTNFMTSGDVDLLHRCEIRAKPVGDDTARSAIPFHEALQKLQRCGLVPLHGFPQQQPIPRVA
jgi:hypothetical protein